VARNAAGLTPVAVHANRRLQQALEAIDNEYIAQLLSSDAAMATAWQARFDDEADSLRGAQARMAADDLVFARQLEGMSQATSDDASTSWIHDRPTPAPSSHMTSPQLSSLRSSATLAAVPSSSSASAVLAWHEMQGRGLPCFIAPVEQHTVDDNLVDPSELFALAADCGSDEAIARALAAADTEINVVCDTSSVTLSSTAAPSAAVPSTVPTSASAVSAAAVPSTVATSASTVSAEFDKVTAASDAYDRALEERIQREATKRAKAMMRTLSNQIVRKSVECGLLGFKQQMEVEVQQQVEAHTRQIQETFDAELAEVKATHDSEQVKMVLDSVIARLELSVAHEAERVVTKATLENELVTCESQVEAVQELMPLKNFLQVGAKLGESKAQVKKLEKQLSEEQRSHADSLEIIRGQLAAANARLQKLAIGDRSLERADAILKAMRAGGPGRRDLVKELRGRSMPSVKDRAQAAGITPQQFNRLLQHIETILYGSGVGDIFRTKLLLSALLERPAVRWLLGSEAPRTKRMVETASAMLLSARAVLKGLGTKGSFTAADRLHFEGIVTALIPDAMGEAQAYSIITELLGIDRRQLGRGRKRKAALAKVPPEGRPGAFSSLIAESVKRQRRSDFNEEGRKLCRTYWHQHTRFDTNARKKRRHRIGVNKAVEHWRHIQYDTNQEMWDGFIRSAEYGAYLLLGGKPISRSLFFEMKCWCIVNADHEECACPLCTQMFELIKDFHRQRSSWYRDADRHRAADPDAPGECACGNCAPGSAYRDASKSVHAFNDFMLCPKEAFPSLQIPVGPHAFAEVKLRRRQCCRAPLLVDHTDQALATTCQDCGDCGIDRRMPHCPLENTNEPAEYKVYAPRGDSNQEALVTVKGTRTEFMAQFKKIYKQWLPHHWTKTWCDHQRRLTYATCGYDEACISTDFSAVYDHKAFATKCCEQPHHSNMDVFVVTYFREEDGKRVAYTEVVRVISEAKGGTHFHNVALKQIVEYLRTIIPGLKRVYTFTDGCKGQYKGRKNFARIAEFPSLHDGVQLVHRFSASHHFKGPHDQYGKDAKALTRTAEKNKKRRLPFTYDWYDFLATEMAAPLKKARSMRQAIDEMQASQEAIAAAREEEARLTAIAARQKLVRVRLNVGASGVHVGLHIPKQVRQRAEVQRALAQDARGLARRAARSKRAARKRTIIELGEGDEVTQADAKQRIETSAAAINGIFSAHAYTWLYYGTAGSGLKEGVPFGQKCGPGECHRLLDDALEGEADPVPNSDSMYEFAGINPRAAEAELHTKCYPCHCNVCRDQPSLSIEFTGCPNRSQTGFWRRQPCHRSFGAVQRAQQVREDEKIFGNKVRTNELLAAAADPNWRGQGGRAYWLLRTRSKPYHLRSSIKSKQRGVPGIRKGTLVVKAQWYDAIDSTGRKYKLLPEIVHVTVRSIIQEQELEFMRGGSETGDSVFPDELHARIMAHNLANYT
jgi:hypothetical protein